MAYCPIVKSEKKNERESSMKKLMIAATAAICATAGFSLESANIVGFETIGANDAGVQEVAAAFETMTADGMWTIGEKVYDTDAIAGDQIMMLNMDLFDLDYYSFNGFDASGASLGWEYQTSDMMTGELIYTPLQSFKVAKGQVVYCACQSGAVTVAGQVESLEGATVTFEGPGMYDFANPYPKATTLADLNTFCKAGDMFMVLNFNLFDLDYYNCLGDGTWEYQTSDMMTGELIYQTITDASTQFLRSGQGCYYYYETEGSRTWNVSVK
jgi:hypothetical protein